MLLSYNDWACRNENHFFTDAMDNKYWLFSYSLKEGKVKKQKKDKKRKRKVEDEADAMDPLEYYEAVKLQKKKKQKAKEAALRWVHLLPWKNMS